MIELYGLIIWTLQRDKRSVARHSEVEIYIVLVNLFNNGRHLMLLHYFIFFFMFPGNPFLKKYLMNNQASMSLCKFSPY